MVVLELLILIMLHVLFLAALIITMFSVILSVDLWIHPLHKGDEEN